MSERDLLAELKLERELHAAAESKLKDAARGYSDMMQQRDHWATLADRRAEELKDAVSLLAAVHAVHPQPEICDVCKLLGRAASSLPEKPREPQGIHSALCIGCGPHAACDCECHNGEA